MLEPMATALQMSTHTSVEQVGSAVVQSKNKKRRMQLTQLQKELQSHRARFLLWHERELYRAKVRPCSTMHCVHCTASATAVA